MLRSSHRQGTKKAKEDTHAKSWRSQLSFKGGVPLITGYSRSAEWKLPETMEAVIKKKKKNIQ